MFLIKNPALLISGIIASSVIYTASVVFYSKDFLLDGRGDGLRLNYIEIIMLVSIVVFLLMIHAISFRSLVKKLKSNTLETSKFTLFVGTLVFINYILWIFFDFGGVDSTPITGAYLIALLNLQFILPIYSCVATGKKWNVAILFLGVVLTLFQGSTATAFFVVIIIVFRASYMNVITFKKVFISIIILIAASLVVNEIKVMTRGVLTDLNFIDYGIARINQISNLLFFAQNFQFFKNEETGFIAQIVYEIFSYVIPNSILGFDPFLSYEFKYTEIVSNYSGLVSFSTLTWLGKFYLYLYLGLFGSAFIFIVLPLASGSILRIMVVNFHEQKFIPVIYVSELIFILSGDTSSYTRFCLLLFSVLMFRNFSSSFLFTKISKIDCK